MAADAQRPHQYLTAPTRKEELARQIAERDGIAEGLVCVFSVLEPCRTFSLVWKEAHPFVKPPAIRALDALSARAATPDGRTVRPFNPVARQDRTFFEVLMSSEHVLHGFTNRELREHLVRVGFPLAAEAAKHSGQVPRLLRRLHIHQLVAKIPRSRRWRVSLNGRRVMAAAVKLREVAYPGFYAEAA